MLLSTTGEGHVGHLGAIAQRFGMHHKLPFGWYAASDRLLIREHINRGPRRSRQTTTRTTMSMLNGKAITDIFDSDYVKERKRLLQLIKELKSLGFVLQSLPLS